MKIKNLITMVTACVTTGSTLLVWKAFAAETPTAERSVESAPLEAGNDFSEPSGKTDRVAAAASRAILEAARMEILTRAGVTSCREVTEPGDTGIDEAYDAGIIVDATLEEVESALAAAATTPSKEDDIAALRLAHFGSYRFFQQSTGTGTTQSRKD